MYINLAVNHLIRFYKEFDIIDNNIDFLRYS